MMAGRRCTICEHKSRKDIDKALVMPGTSIRGVARQFRVSDDALTRHVKGGHLDQKIAKAAKAQEIVEADDLLKEIQDVEKVTKEILTECRSDGNHRDALSALTRREKQIELKGKVLGAFKEKVEHTGKAGEPIKVENTIDVAAEVKKIVGILPDVKV